MNQEKILVSIIIPTRNRILDLQELVRGIYSQTYPHIEIVIVDNGSTDGTSQWVSKHHPEVKLFCFSTNTGAWVARNFAINQSGGNYLLLLDDDTELHDPNLIEKSLNYFKQDSRLGAIAYRVLDAVSKQVDRELIPRWDRKIVNHDIDVAHFIAAGAMIKRKAFFEAGQFWDLLNPYYGGDMELGYRLAECGYRILQTPALEVMHKKSNEGRQYSRAKARIRYGTAHVPLMAMRNLPLYCVVSLTILAWGYYFMSSLFHGCPHLFFRGVGESIHSLPKAVAMRKPISDQAKHYVKRCRGRLYH